MNFNFDSIIGQLQAGAAEAAKAAAGNFLAEAAGDAKDFVNHALPALARYTDLLVARKITANEFESLVMGLRDQAELAGLTLAGMAATEIDKTRNGILQVLSSTIIGAVSRVIG